MIHSPSRMIDVIIIKGNPVRSRWIFTCDRNSQIFENIANVRLRAKQRAINHYLPKFPEYCPAYPAGSLPDISITTAFRGEGGSSASSSSLFRAHRRPTAAWKCESKWRGNKKETRCCSIRATSPNGENERTGPRIRTDNRSLNFFFFLLLLSRLFVRSPWKSRTFFLRLPFRSFTPPFPAPMIRIYRRSTRASGLYLLLVQFHVFTVVTQRILSRPRVNWPYFAGRGIGANAFLYAENRYERRRCLIISLMSIICVRHMSQFCYFPSLDYRARFLYHDGAACRCCWLLVRMQSRKNLLEMPLVTLGTDGYQRALRGRVVRKSCAHGSRVNARFSRSKNIRASWLKCLNLNSSGPSEINGQKNNKEWQIVSRLFFAFFPTVRCRRVKVVEF